MRKLLILIGLCAMFVSGLAGVARAEKRGEPIRLAGLDHAARLVQDRNGITHIEAVSTHDVFFLQGWVHARDRLFQMDVARRQGSGTLAELLGKAALSSDVQARTIGLRRAAERTWAQASSDLHDVVVAYTAGVNAYAGSHPLPAEYRALNMTSFAPWTPVDSLTIGKAIAFELSFDLDIGPTVQLEAYVAALGPQRGMALFSQDAMRSAPFNPASTVPDATVPDATVPNGVAAPTTAPASATTGASAEAATSPLVRLGAADLPALSEAARLGRAYLSKVGGDPLFQQAMSRDGSQGSNEWAVAGSHTVDGRPLVANDPHLSLGSPSTFYPVGLKAEGMDVEGEGFAGVPSVIIGHNRSIAWGATTNPMDVTDTFQEKLVVDPTSPSSLSTVHLGSLEHVIPIPETFRYNNNGQLTTATSADGVPPVTLIVPRRNNGPIVQVDPANSAALSIQYTGFSATFELETFLRWDRARNLADFQQGLDFFAVGSQNWAYADTRGNVAYFTSAEMPVREDLQAGAVNGLPPWFIRNGQGGNDWLGVQHPQPHQAIPYEIYPASEMPHLINPPAGWFVNANNDPAGTTLDNNPLNQFRPGGGIYYLNSGYDGFRAGRITEMLRERLSGGGKVSMADIERMQADVTELDAEYFVPYITRALTDAKSSQVTQLATLARDPQIAEAVDRLAHWDFTMPTGIPQGYDASDINGVLGQPTPTEVAHSVAATIYAAWRSRAVTRVVDDHLGPLPKPDGAEALTAFRHLLDTFGATKGIGASGLNFFAVPGITDPTAARDYLLLSSLRDGLNLLSSSGFAAAFHQSSNQQDYRWGLLHRLVLQHPLGGPFSVPPAFGQFPQPLPGLPGIPVDGGFETVDAASHDVRAATVNGFMFGGGPARRFVGEPTMRGIIGVSALPGGTSADPSSPFYLNLLRPYLTDDYYPALLANQVKPAEVASITHLIPPDTSQESVQSLVSPPG